MSCPPTVHEDRNDTCQRTRSAAEHRDLAEYLGVPVTTIYDWRVEGKGPCGIRVGRHVKFTVSDVLAWIAEQRESRPGQHNDGR